MKLYLDLNEYQSKKLFADVYNRSSFCRVKLYVLEYLLTYWHYDKVKNRRPFLCVDVDDTKRVYIINESGDKIISFVFDYNVRVKQEVEQNGNIISFLSIQAKNYNCEITPKLVADAQSIIQTHSDREDNLMTYTMLDFEEEAYDDRTLRFVENLLYCEPGYIRYDNSTQGYKPYYHPQYHFDINYSNDATFKFGLPNIIDVNKFIDLVNSQEKRPTLICEWQREQPPLKSKEVMKKIRNKRK